jgi:transcriptional regulator GlxA family with amidase domain
LLVPGGFGTRTEWANPALIAFLRERAPKAEVTMSVCTGSALLAAAGLLDGRRATSNKMFFHEVTAAGPQVEWVREARWVEDGRYVTSSGVSAGIDMALAVIARLYGAKTSEDLALATEYEWHRDASWDPFARAHGLV